MDNREGMPKTKFVDSEGDRICVGDKICSAFGIPPTRIEAKVYDDRNEARVKILTKHNSPDEDSLANFIRHLGTVTIFDRRAV